MSKHKRSSRNHSGFQKNKSCIDATLNYTAISRKTIDQRNFGISCFVDFKKAFDTIDHEIMLEKLELYGFSEEIWEFVASYLKDRKQIVECNGQQSAFQIVNYGVPQ